LSQNRVIGGRESNVDSKLFRIHPGGPGESDAVGRAFYLELTKNNYTYKKQLTFVAITRFFDSKIC